MGEYWKPQWSAAKLALSEIKAIHSHMSEDKYMPIKKKIKTAKPDDSLINDNATGDPVQGEAFVKVVNELMEGYTLLYEKGLSTSMIAVLVAHYGGCTVNEATAVFNGVKELAAKLKYKQPDCELPEFN